MSLLAIPPRRRIFEEHLDEAGFLFTQWEHALDDPSYSIAEVADGPEARLLANVDGLVIPGRKLAEKLLVPALEGDEPGPIFAAALALLSSEDGDFSYPVLEALGAAEDEPRAALVRALQLVERPDILVRLGRLIASPSPLAQAAAVEVLAFQRLGAAAPLDPLLSSREPSLRKAALALARLFPERAHPQLIEQLFETEDPEERHHALVTGLIVSVRSAWPRLDAWVREGGPGWELASVTWATSGERDIAPLVHALSDEDRRGAALIALGFTGWRTAVDAVLPFLDDRSVAPYAAEALSAVSGLVLDGKFVRGPPGWDPDNSDDDDEMPDLPLPEPGIIRDWWLRSRRRFDPGVRYTGGEPRTLRGVVAALESGPTRRRRALAVDLAIRTRGEVQLETRDFARRQLGELVALRSTPVREKPGNYRELLQYPPPQRPPAPPRVRPAT